MSLKSLIDEKNAHDVRYLRTFGLKDAEGVIKEINQQIDRDLMIVPPNSLSTPSERVHAVRWAGIREFMVAETHVPRWTKETIASTLSKLNACPYCEEAHDTALSALKLPCTRRYYTTSDALRCSAAPTYLYRLATFGDIPYAL